MAILNFIVESLSTHKAVETKWSLFFYLSLFFSPKNHFLKSGGHFEFFWQPFFKKIAESLSTHKAEETKWFLFFDLSLFPPLKNTFKQSSGHFEFFLRNLNLLTKLWKQSGFCFLI